MLDLKFSLKKINEVIPVGSTVWFFDYPVYDNIGDMLIWKGTEQFFKDSKVKVLKRLSCHLLDHSLTRKEKFMEIPKEVVIVCQGGGNFGDFYPIHQNVRKLLVKHYPNNRIVFLPQTIFYENKKKMKEDMMLFSNHKDLHLFVRDKNSFLIASKFLNNVVLSQDMAHALYPIKQKKKRKLGTLHFLRRDKEIGPMQYNIKEKEIDNLFDWDQLFSRKDKIIYKFLKKAHSSYKIQKLVPSYLLTKLWYMYSTYIIKKAVNLFCCYEMIITSRLHGHILGCLMNKKNILIDNSYGKNSTYYDCWTKSIENAQLMKDSLKKIND